jgi:hypothetical protein
MPNSDLHSIQRRRYTKSARMKNVLEAKDGFRTPVPANAFVHSYYLFWLRVHYFIWPIYEVVCQLPSLSHCACRRTARQLRYTRQAGQRCKMATPMVKYVIRSAFLVANHQIWSKTGLSPGKNYRQRCWFTAFVKPKKLGLVTIACLIQTNKYFTISSAQQIEAPPLVRQILVATHAHTRKSGISLTNPIHPV